MPQYRHWKNTACNTSALVYAYDGPDAEADGDDAAIELAAERVQTGATTYHKNIVWHVRLYVNGVCVHEFAESHPDEVPTETKEDARGFASRWVRVHPRPLTALGVTIPPVGVDPAGAQGAQTTPHSN